MKGGYKTWIRIVAIPCQKGVPDEIRQSWVNLEFPGVAGVDLEAGKTTRIIDLTPAPAYNKAFMVDQVVAFKALQKRSPTAYTWYTERGLPREDYYLVFHHFECVEIRTPQDLPSQPLVQKI